MARNAVPMEDLPLELRKKLGLVQERKRTFTKEQVRSRALDVLSEISDLTQDQRRQVLNHALKVNAT